MDRLQLSCVTNTSSESTCVQSITSSLRDWAGLLPELLDIVASKLGSLADFIRFCGVCPQWRWVALESDACHKKTYILLKACRKKIPMLMIKTEEHNDDTRGLYNLCDGMTYDIKLPQPCKSRVFGSSHGWLMCFEESKAITLLNPLNYSCITLPVFTDSVLDVNWSNSKPGYFLQKGILSADPLVSPNNYMVVIIYDGLNSLAVYEAGYLHWKFLNLQPTRDYGFSDVAFYKSNLYGVTFNRKLVQIDISSQSGKTIIPQEVKDEEDETNNSAINCLVESQQGEFFLVQRFWLTEEDIYNHEEVDVRNSFRAKTFSFKVFKLVHEKELAKWVQVSNIGEQALFVGDNHSFSVSTVEFPECLLSNAVYFTSQYYWYILPYECGGPDEDSGFFGLEDKSLHSHHRLDLCQRYLEPPIWFAPNPSFF